MKPIRLRRTSPAILTLPPHFGRQPATARPPINPVCAILLVSLLLWTALFFAGWAIVSLIVTIS
jgi:hypothetical protein